jgi:hypothetical protein
MFANANLAVVVDEIDVLLAEMREIRATGPHLVIVHRFHKPGTACAAGEEIVVAFLLYRGKDYDLRLSTPHLLLFDYLCRHRRVALSATQVAMGLNNESFYVHHASNATDRTELCPRSSRTAVKQQIMRLRQALAKCFAEAHLRLDPTEVLRSEMTSSNEVKYRIHANVGWEH